MSEREDMLRLADNLETNFRENSDKLGLSYYLTQQIKNRFDSLAEALVEDENWEKVDDTNPLIKDLVYISKKLKIGI